MVVVGGGPVVVVWWCGGLVVWWCGDVVMHAWRGIMAWRRTVEACVIERLGRVGPFLAIFTGGGVEHIGTRGTI